MADNVKSSKNAPGESPTQRILLVEDDAFLRQVLDKVITKLGYEAHLAESGVQALALIDEQNYDLILTDCRMPQMDGHAFVAAVRAREADQNTTPTPIIGMTGGTDDYWGDAVINGNLLKPIKLDELRETLNAWL